MDRDLDVLTAAEAGAILGRSDATVRRWARSGLLRSYRHGFQFLFRRADVEALRKSRAQARAAS